jgi:hypothetical protein
MSLADPLTLAQFSDLIQGRVADCSLMLEWQQQMSGTGGGETIYADRAPPVWTGTVTIGEQLIADAEGTMALLNSRAGGLKTLLLPNYRGGLYPSSDPTGATFGSSTPQVNGTPADQYHIAFKGFPANYVLPRGTYFQILFNSTSYYLGQVCEAVTADSSGNVASVEVAPSFPASVADGDAVSVIKPAAKFKIVPGTAAPTVSNALYEKIAFQVRQTYQ